jgi:hypothetical protein
MTDANENRKPLSNETFVTGSFILHVTKLGSGGYIIALEDSSTKTLHCPTTERGLPKEFESRLIAFAELFLAGYVQDMDEDTHERMKAADIADGVHEPPSRARGRGTKV